MPRPSLRDSLALLSGLFLLGVPSLAQVTETPRAPASAGAPVRIVAQGGGRVLTEPDLTGLLVRRHAMGQEGRDVLRLAVTSALIESIAASRGMQVTDKDIDALWDRIDRQAREAGETAGIGKELEERGLDRTAFRHYLGLSVLHERLTRDALGLGPDVEVTGDMQSVWIDQEIRDRGLFAPSPPWDDGTAARCGEIKIEADEYGRLLTRQLSRDIVQEAAWHLLLVASIQERMPDLSAEARAQAIDADIQRRRLNALSGGNPGVSFEEMLRAQGNSIERLKADPSVGIAALSRLWIDRTVGDDGLRKAFVNRREFFEGHFGESVQVHILLLRAARLPNEFNPRSFSEAEAELSELIKGASGLARFQVLARRHSEDPSTREKSGEYSRFTRLDERVPSTIRELAFQRVDTGGGLAEGGELTGPLRLEGGAAILWVSARRDGPPWKQMKEHVHRELRRAFIEEVLPLEGVTLLPARSWTTGR